MGRHAAPPPSSRTVNRPVPGRRTSTATAGFLVAGAGLALAGATVLGLTAAGITLAPRAPAAAVAQPEPTPTVQGVALTDSQSLLGGDFFTRINLPWGPDPLVDQHTAGMIAWGIGEAPTLILAVIIAAQWVRTDRVETRRKDRQADRDGDADLTAYNDYLASLRGQGEQR